MNLFLHGHATHPDAQMALALAAAQVEAQRQQRGSVPSASTSTSAPAPAPTLGWLYLTDHFAPHAESLLADVRQRWPGVAWVGAVGVGIAANGAEYFDEPALSLMLAALPREQFRLFSGVTPLALSAQFSPSVAQVHADPATPDLAGL